LALIGLACGAFAAIAAAPAAPALPPASASATPASIAKPDHFAELAGYQAILSRDPTNRAALRGTILTLSRLGAPHLALELADRHEGILDSGEREAMSADRTAYRIRWGAIEADSGRGLARFAGIDRALTDSESAAIQALDPAVNLTATERQLSLDRIGALRERFRMREAVELYQALAARPAPMPAYAISDAASAYLYLQQPEKARDLYRQALVLDPNNLTLRIGLFYALAEAEQHKEALAEAEYAVETTPQWIDAWSPATTRENPAYPQALAARAMAPLLADRPGEAEARLHALSDRAPYNMDIRTDYASSMRARGWPRAAVEELQWILEAEPDNSGALGERAGALLEMRAYSDAQIALPLAQAVNAENGRVLRAARLLRVHDMAELIVDAGFGKSSGGPIGTRDFAIESWLYSRPFGSNYRAFAHLYSAEARFAGGTGNRDRAGVGLEYRSPLIQASGELAHVRNNSGTAAALSLAITPNDRWTFSGGYDSSANQTPLQASLARIDAKRAFGEVTWRANESRSASISQARMNFDDGNRRDTTQARWTERLITGPVYKLEATASVYASKNSFTGTPYFNPRRDFSPGLEFANEWLQWRRYTRSFKHRLVLGVGSYSQQGFDNGRTANVRYEQEWNADDRLSVRYGIGRSLHPYDGIQTARNYAFLSLNWRF
jgi:biofilm PGA synthesis protein PgaA